MPIILVADDNSDVRRPLVRLLKSEGYDVIAAANTNEVMAHTQRHHPDLILLDVSMPPIDGLTFLSLLRDSPGGGDLPIIIVTALSDAQTRKRAEDLGVKDYLVKSQFTPEELIEAVKRHVRGAGIAKNQVPSQIQDPKSKIQTKSKARKPKPESIPEPE